jgi:hypothetical protein
MYEYHDQSPSELLNSYMEGDLDNQGETRLFRMLAENEELRIEMRDHLNIGMLVRGDSEKLLPSSALRQQVFRAVGIGASAPPSAPPAVAPWYGRPLAISILSALASALLTLGVVGGVERGAVDGRVEGTKGTVSGVVTVPKQVSGRDGREQEHEMATGPAPVAELNQQKRFSERGSGGPAITERQGSASHRHQVLESTGNADTVATAPRAPKWVLAQRVNGPQTLQLPADSIVILLVPRVAVGENFPQRPATEPDRRIAVSMRGMRAASFPAIEQAAGSSPWFNDMSVGVSYAANDHQSLGLEVGQESFPQEYSGQENGQTVHYRQRPLLFWAGLTYQQRFNGLAIGDHIVPFAQGTVGATEVGGLGRLAAGLLYRADGRTTFSLGAEGSWLPYKFQGTWFTGTGKLGVTYGLSLLF